MAGSRTSLRLYRALLRLYPATFRDRFGDEMVQLLDDQLRDARSAGSTTSTAAAWLRVVGDLIVTSVAERLAGDRGLARSLAAPSVSSRVLGFLGVVGGLAILAAFVVQKLIFEDQPWLITVRLLLFNLGAVAIVLGLRRRRASNAHPQVLESIIGWATMGANAWYAGMILLPVVGWAPFAGDNHMVGFLAGLALWVTAVLFGLVVARGDGILRVGGMTLSIGSALTLLGIDRLGLTHGELAFLFVPIALAGQGLNGLGWLFLGYDLATRRRLKAEPLPKA